MKKTIIPFWRAHLQQMMSTLPKHCHQLKRLSNLYTYIFANSDYLYKKKIQL